MDAETSKPLGRNEPCHCQSGRKYKQCCLAKDEDAARTAREATRAEAQKAADAAAAEKGDGEEHPAKQHAHSPHGKGPGRSATNTRGFQKAGSAPRKVGGG